MNGWTIGAYLMTLATTAVVAHQVARVETLEHRVAVQRVINGNLNSHINDLDQQIEAMRGARYRIDIPARRDI